MKFLLLSSSILAGLAMNSAALAQTATAAPPVNSEPSVSATVAAPTPPATTTPSDSLLGEIVITAQRRSENLQRAAISVSALGGDQLTKQNITIPSQLTTLVPAFRANNIVGPYANFTIRGIGTFASTPFAEGAVVVNVEGVPLASPISAQGLLYDLQRVEILKGPQGTLYGRNASAGVVNLIARKPGNEFAGNLGVSVGNYSSRIVQGGVDLPITDTLTTRTAFQISRHDGYYKDGTDDGDNQSARFTVQFKPNVDITASIVGDYSHDGGRGNGSTLIRSETATNSTGGGFYGDPRSGTYLQDPSIVSRFTADNAPTRNPANSFQDNTAWGVTGTLDWKLGFGNLTLIAGHRESDVFYVADVPSFYYGDKGKFTQSSIEARLGGEIGGRLKWLFGGFYLKGKNDVLEVNENNTTLATSDIHNRNYTVAGFGQATYELTDRLRLTGGIRYSVDHKSTNSPRYNTTNFPFASYVFTTFPTPAASSLALLLKTEHTWKAVTYKGGVEFDLAPDSLLYANIDKGYKSGVFFYASPTVNTANPEYVKSYTIGSKNRFFDRKLQVNVEAFYLDYTNQQLNTRTSLPIVGNVTVTSNIGRSKIYGAEADIRYALSPTTQLSFITQYEHARLTSFSYVSPTDTSGTQNCPVTGVTGGFQVNCSGRPSLFTPTWIVQGGVQQKFAFSNGSDLTFNVNSRFETARWLQISYIPEAHQGSYTQTDAQLTYHAPSGNWSVGAWVNNIENSNIKTVVYLGRLYTKARGGLLTTVLQAPRTFGGRVDVKF